MTDSPKRRFDNNILVGIVMIGFGALFLLDNLGYFDFGSIWRYTPLIVVMFGVQQMMNAQNANQSGNGIWLMFIGLWLFVSMNEFWDLGFRETWPMLIIGWGVGVIWKSLGRPLPFHPKEQ